MRPSTLTPETPQTPESDPMNIGKTNLSRTRYARPFLVGLTLLAMLILPAAPSSAATVYKFSTKGDALYGSSYITDGCSYAVESVDVADSKKTAPTISYIAYGYDCNTGSSYTYYGSGTPSTFEFDNNLSSAHIEADLALYDYYTGAPIGQKSLDLTWTGTGPVTKGIYKYRTTVDGQYKDSYRTSGTSRSASVTGSFDGSGSMATSGTVSHTVIFG